MAAGKRSSFAACHRNPPATAHLFNTDPGFGYSLFFSHGIGPVEWGCLILAIVGNALVIKGKWDLGRATWTGYYLPAVKGLRAAFLPGLRTPCIPELFWDYLVQPGLHYPTTHMAERTGADLLFLHRWILIMAALREDRQLVQA